MNNEGRRFVTEAMLGLSGVSSKEANGWDGVVVRRYDPPHDSFCRVEFVGKNNATLLNGITQRISRLVRPKAGVAINQLGFASPDSFFAFHLESCGRVEVSRYEQYLLISTRERDLACMTKVFFKTMEKACEEMGLRLAKGNVRYGVVDQKELRVNTAFDPSLWELWDGQRRFADPDSRPQTLVEDLIRLDRELEDLS